MSDKHKTDQYLIKPRPNLFDLSIMDGFLSGGGDTAPVQREAYWSRAPSPEATEIQMLENPDQWDLYDDLDDL